MYCDNGMDHMEEFGKKSFFNKGEKYLPGVLIVIVIFLVVSTALFLLAQSPEGKLAQAFINTGKRLGADYRKINQMIGLDQDFSKEFFQELQVVAKHISNNSNINQELGTKLSTMFSEKEKVAQLGLSIVKEAEIIDMLIIEQDDFKVKIAFPDLSDMVLSVSSKNFGKQMREIGKKYGVKHAFRGDEDYSFSASVKRYYERRGKNLLIANPKEVFFTLREGVEIESKEGSYFFKIPSINLKNAIDMWQLPEELTDSSYSEMAVGHLFFRLKNQLKQIFSEFDLKVQVILKNDLVEYLKISFIKANKVQFVVDFKFHKLSFGDNLWSDIEMNIDEFTYGERVTLECKGEYSSSLVAQQLKVSDRYRIAELVGNLSFDKTKPKDNFQFELALSGNKKKMGDSLSDLLKEDWQKVMELKANGSFVQDEHSFSFDIPYFGLLAEQERMILGISFSKSRDVSKRRTLLNDIPLISITEEQQDKLLKDVSDSLGRYNDFNYKKFKMDHFF